MTMKRQSVTLALVLLFALDLFAADFRDDARKAYKALERQKRSMYAANAEYQPRKLDTEKAIDDLDAKADADKELLSVLEVYRDHIDLARFYNDSAIRMGTQNSHYDATVAEQKKLEAVVDSCSAVAAKLLDGATVEADTPCIAVVAKKKAMKK
jgi:hypothetical protein